MLFSTIFLSLCALVSAIPPTKPPTCPASTPYTTVYVTTITKTLPTTTLLSRSCPSFSTRVDTPAPWSSCSFNTLTCTRPACLQIQTITQPCITDPCCTRTATDTVYATCLSACPTGCATSWTVVSASCTTARPRPTPEV